MNRQMTNSPNQDKRKPIIRAEDQILYLCARQNFLSTHHQILQDICRREIICWDEIYTASEYHGVTPLVSVNLSKFDEPMLSIPVEIAEKFRLSAIHNIAMTGKRTDQMAKVYAFFENLSIDIMPIKGAAHEILVYEQPWYITANDLDLIIKLDPAKFKETDRWVLEDLKVDIPLEYDFMTHHDVTMNGVLPIDFHMIWGDARGIRYKEQQVYVMSPEDMLIAACINSCRKRYFRLKAMFDIAEITNKFPDMDWTELLRKAKAYQCNNIVYTALWATNGTIGCEAPASVYSDLNVNPFRAQIINRLIERQSSHPLTDPISEKRIFGRRASLSLVLPYASYRWDQTLKKIAYVMSS